MLQFGSLSKTSCLVLNVLQQRSWINFFRSSSGLKFPGYDLDHNCGFVSFLFEVFGLSVIGKFTSRTIDSEIADEVAKDFAKVRTVEELLKFKKKVSV